MLYRFYLGIFQFNALFISAVVVANTTSFVALQKLSFWPITAFVAIFLAIYYWRQSGKERDLAQVPPPYGMVSATIVMMVVFGVVIFNAVRMLSYEGSLVTVGTNDDNMNHIALSVISIKEGNMLFNSPQIKKMMEGGMYSPGMKWYPYGLYSFVNYIYNMTLPTHPPIIDLRHLFNVHNSIMLFQLLMLLCGIHLISDRLGATKSIYSLPLTIIFGVFVIAGQFYLRLFTYGFYSQLIAYNLLIASLLMSDDVMRKKSADHMQSIYFSTLIFSLGVTYYLFIPLGFALTLWTHIRTGSKPMRLAYPLIVFGTIPLLMFHINLRIGEQIEAYGVSFVLIDGFVLALMGPVLLIFKKRNLNRNLSSALTMLIGLTLVQMVATAVSTFAKTNNLTYYFFKSYWTLGVLGLPMILVFITSTVDAVIEKSATIAIVVFIVLTITASIVTYMVFSGDGYTTRGYDTSLMIFNGKINYFNAGEQKKWILVYERWGETRGRSIFPVGLWGWTTLSYALFGDVPELYRSNFRIQQYHISHNNMSKFFDAVEKSELANEKPILLDGMGTAGQYLQHIPNLRRRFGGDILERK